jgi:phosphoribosylglycinamide formyltransferase-1
MRCCIVISSGGSVVNHVLKIPEVKSTVFSIVTDRECNAQKIASENGVPIVEFFSRDNLIFSEALLGYCKEEKIDFIISFHVRMYAGLILEIYKNRIINFHLSLLPAFPGFNAFEKALAFGAKVLGTTVHFIDNTMDMGLPILQTVILNNPALTTREKRHLLFVQQCKSLIQVIEWLRDNRIAVFDKERSCIVKDAKYDDLEFIPALDSSFALEFKV